MSSQKREVFKEKLKVQLGYVNEFLHQDQKSDHVRYSALLINPLVYVVAAFMAFVLYYDYLHTDHIDKVSYHVNKFLTSYDLTSKTQLAQIILAYALVILAITLAFKNVADVEPSK